MTLPDETGAPVEFVDMCFYCEWPLSHHTAEQKCLFGSVEFDPMPTRMYMDKVIARALSYRGHVGITSYVEGRWALLPK